jgi:CheY-like chemotaxis protein
VQVESGIGARPATATRKGTLRVLIVDDNREAAEMLAMAASQLGHATKQAYDGVAAVSAAAEFGPDVILLDIGLPGMNGYEVAHAVRALPGCTSTYIAAVTGWGQDEDRRKAREAGFDGHFTKPLSPEALERLLAAVEQGPTSAPRTRRTDTANPT